MLNILFRWWVFFPIVVFGAAALVLASLGSALIPPPTGPAAGQALPNGVLLAGEDLAHAQASPETVVYVPRDAAMRASGVRVASKAGAGAVRPGERGVQIALTAEAAQRLGAGALRVDVTIAPVPVTTAASVAVGLVRGGAMEWVTLPTPGVQSVVSFPFPRAANGAAPSAVGVRPIGADEENNFGIEVREIRIRRAG